MTQDTDEAFARWMADTNAPALRRMDAEGAHAAGYAAGATAERERLERDVEDLHMAQSVNNQNYPSAWHDGVDAALQVIRGTEYVRGRAKRAEAERDALLAALKHIAAIAHSGGAAGLDGFDAMCAVRRLTRKYWDSKQTEDEKRLAAVDAVRASDCR